VRPVHNIDVRDDSNASVSTRGKAEPVTRRALHVLSQRGKLASFAPLAVTVALFVAISLYAPGFASPSSLNVLANQASLLLVIAIGQTMVILTGGIDLSVGALVSFGSVLLAYALPSFGLLAAIGVVLLMGAIGAAQGWLHVTTQVPSFIVTLGTQGLWSGMALTITGGLIIQVSEGYESVEWVTGETGGISNSFLISLLVLVIVGLLITFRPGGRQLRAVGLTESAALIAGVRTGRIKIGAFAASGLCSGLAAVILVSGQFSGSPVLGDYLLLPSITAVVVGGTAITGGHGGVSRTLVGTILVTTLSVGMSVVGVGASYTNLVYGLVLIVAVALAVRRSGVAAIIK
jgi:ribose transport system permease protein